MPMAAALVAALLTTPSLVIAENREGAFTLSPFAGAQGFPVFFNGENHFDADFYGGFRAGYNFTQNFRGELLFGYNYTVRDPGDIPCSLYQYGADLNYHFLPNTALVPFVAAGFGGLTADWDDNALHSETSPYVDFGGGVEYFLTRWVALRADFRHSITLDHGEHGWMGRSALRSNSIDIANAL